MQNEVSVIIDNFLNHLNLNRNGGNLYSVEHRDNNSGREAIQLMKLHNLISERNPGNSGSIVDITSEGLSVIENGGYKNFIDNIKVKKIKKEAYDEEKSRYDLANAKRIYKTYWWTFGFALAAFLISLFNLYKTFTK